MLHNHESLRIIIQIISIKCLLMNSRGEPEGYRILRVNETSVRGVIESSELSVCRQNGSDVRRKLAYLHRTTGTREHVGDAHM